LDLIPVLRRGDFLKAIVLICPLVLFLSAVLWFSHNPVSPTPANEASLANPLGFLTSNFVYDGIVNIENILTSSGFLLLVCIFYPRNFRILAVWLLPLVALGAGALAEFTAISTHYTSLGICTIPCSFYGMSAIASGTIGFTVACFLIWFGLEWFGRDRSFQSDAAPNAQLRRNQVIVIVAFVSYILLLLLFSGILGLLILTPTHPQTSTGTSVVSPPPPAVLTEPAPTAFVHSAGLVYGLLFCISLFFQVNRHYHIFGLAPKK